MGIFSDIEKKNRIQVYGGEVNIGPGMFEEIARRVANRPKVSALDVLAGQSELGDAPEMMEAMSARSRQVPVLQDDVFDPLASETTGVLPIVDVIAQAAMKNVAPAVHPIRRVDAIDAITTAADTGFEDFTPEQIDNPVSVPSMVQDAAATAMAIPYTAASTGVSAANLLTGGMLDDAVTAMNEGERALRQSFGSDELNRQVDAVNAVQQNRDSGLFDVLVAAANNPRALAYDAIRNLGTMALPTGAAIGAGKLAQAAPALSRYVPALGRVAPWMANNAGKIGTGASMAANAFMNASDTFSDEDMMKQSLGERYAGSGVSAVTSLLTGALTDGGAEGQIARRILSGRQGAASGALNYLKGLGKSAVKEGLQEYGEESGNYLGKVFGTNGLADFNEMNKQAGYASVLGSLTGSASHVGTNLGGQRQQVEPLSAMEKEMDRRLAVDALRPENAQRVVPNMPNTPDQNDRGDFLSRVVTELEKIRRQNEQQVQARYGQAQRVEPQEVNLPAGLFEKMQTPVQVPENLSTRLTEPVTGSPETPVQVPSEPVVRRQEPVAETARPGAEPEQNVSENPLDVIVANGGISRSTVKNDLGWTDAEIAKLPEGVVRDDGKALSPVKRALKQAGLDTDVNAILDAAARPEAPEDAQLFQSREGDAKRENERMVSSSEDMNVGPVQEAWRSARANGDADYADYFGFYAKSADPGIAPRRMAEDYLQGRRSDFYRVILDNHRKMLGQTVSGNESIRQDAQQIRQTSQPEPGIKQVMRDVVENGQSADGHVVFQQVKDTPKIQLEKQSSTVQFSGEELGGLDVPIKTLKVRAANYARKHFSGKTVTIASDGTDVLIPWQGIKHALTGQVHPVSALVTSKLDKLIENGVLIGTDGDKKDRPDIRAAYFYDTPIQIDGKDDVVRIVVREHIDGKRYYDHFKLRSNASVGPTERVTGSMSGSTAHQPNRSVGETPESSVNEKKVRDNLPTGGTEYLTGAVPGQQTSQLAKEGQPDAAENNVSRSGVKGQEETDPPRERAPSSHSVAGTPRAISGQSGNETTVNENPSVDADETALEDRVQPHAVESGQTKAVSEQKIEDSGRKIRARKDEYAFLETMRKDADDGDLSLSRHFPEPNYAALIEAGVSEDKLAVFRMIRDEVPAKPKYPSSRWAANFRLMRDLAAGIVDGKVHVEDVVSKIGNGRYSQAFRDRLALYQGVGYPAFTRIKSFGYGLYADGQGYRIYKKRRYVENGRHGTLKDAIDDVKKRINAEIDAGKGKKREVKLDIYRVRDKDGIVVGKILSPYKHVVLKDGFKTRREAADYLAENREVLEKQWEALKKDPAVRREENLPRTGKDRRGGKDVTQKRFMETFGFSGDTYGNWVTQKERQDFLNNTYDALMDLSEVLGISPKAISLNGELGIQFGASGKAGANAHYRPDDVSINLTRKKGAGSLAHEWFHALDNYFARMGGSPDGMMTKGSVVGNRVRQEMKEAFADVSELLSSPQYRKRSTEMDRTRKDAYWSTREEMGARAFESYIITKAEGLDITNDFLANIMGEDVFVDPERYPYPTGEEKAEIDKAFDRLFDAIREKETEKGVALYSGMNDRKPIPEGQGMSVDAVRAIARDFAMTFRNAPEITVTESPLDFSPDAMPDGTGLFDPGTGKCWLFSRNLRDADDATATLAHEVIAHYGLRGFFGDSLGDVLVSIRNHNPKVEKLSQEWWRNNQDYISQVRKNEGKKWTEEQFEKWQRDIAIEEAMAQLAEKGDELTGVKLLVRKIQELLRDITRRLGWRWPSNLANWLESKTDAEALSALHQAGLFARGEISGRTTTTQSDIEKYRISDDGSLQNDDPVVLSRKVKDARKAFDVPDITLGDMFVRSVQDDNVDLKRVIDAIREQGGIVTDRTDAYMAEEAYLGKTKAKLDRFSKAFVVPVLEKVRASGVSLDEAGRYIHARHVMLDQVNAKLKAINPDSTSDRLAGMSNREAREILDRNRGNTALQELGKMMDDLARYTRSVMLNGGLITRETYDHWGKTYQHYVPLYRDLEGAGKQSVWERLKEADYKPWNIREEGQGNRDGGRRGRGFEVRGEESKRRMGSDLDVTNVIVNAVAQAEGAIIRSEKAKVALALLELAKNNPNPDFWSVDEPVLTKRISPETGLVEYVSRNPNTRPADNVLVVKENGRERWIVFNEKNRRAMEVARKFRNLDGAALHWTVDAIGGLTRWMAGWLTQKNPIFMFFNFQRDLQHAVFNMSDTPIAGKEGAFLKNVPRAMKGYWQMTRQTDQDAVRGVFADYAREFREAGAETGFIKSFESIKDRITDVEKQLEEMSRGKGDPRTWLAIAGRAVDDYNAIVENGVRLAAYVTARENGLSISRAAQLAKNITVNFNKRGTSGRWLNALYMFANANIQGNARMLRALVKSKRARIYAGFMVGIGFMMDMVCSAVLGTDDETGQPIWDEVSEFDKERNWIIPVSTTNYIKIPLPQGLHILPNVGRMLSEFVRTGGKKNALESAARVVLMTADTLSPLGSSGSWLQMVFPSVLRPLVQMKENKSFTGSVLYRGDAPYGGYNEPAYAKAFRNTPKHWIDASRMLNFATGGDDVTPGMVNVPPEALRLAVTSYVVPGVSSQLIDRAFDVLAKKGGGEELELRDLPIVSRMVGEMPDERVRERAFYDRMNGWRQNVLQIRQYEKQERWDDADRAIRRLGDGDYDLGIQRLEMFDDFSSELRDLNRERKEAERSGDKEWSRAVEAERKGVFAGFGGMKGDLCIS